MKHIITDPEETEKRLRDAGFKVSLTGMGFEVGLKNRRLLRSEVAVVLDCETDDLTATENGVLVK